MLSGALRSPKTWKILLLVKIAVLGGLWIMMDGNFHLGDLDLFAADNPKDEKMADAKDTAAAAAPKEGKDGETTAKTRKSFLANLLELPPLDPGSVQKEELGKYLEIAERKKQQIEDRLGVLKNREDQLKGLETSIEDKIKHLDEERRFFAQTVQQEKNLKGDRTEKLVAMYAKMEPKKAAPVMEKLDKDLVVELFKAMPQKQVTSILETMSPDKSVMISEYYGRVRSTREYDVLKEMNESLRKEFDDCKGMPKEAPPQEAEVPAAPK